jgi:glycosyltransferase involved in cell wall biosynthesis
MQNVIAHIGGNHEEKRAMKPLISILTGVYNGLPYVRETIASVLAQSFTDWEMLISDDASTDNTVEVLKQFQDPRIKVIEQPKNLGMAKNQGFLLEQSQAKFGCILDSDDLFLPNHLKRKLELLEHYTDSPFVHGAVRFIDSNGAEIPSDDYGCATLEPRKVTLERFTRVNFVNLTSAVFRMETVRKHKLKLESRYPLIVDWPFFMKLAMFGGSVVYDDIPTSVYRIRSNSIARSHQHTFNWSYDGTRLIVDALMEFPKIWTDVGIDPGKKASWLTRNFARLAFQQFRRGRLTNAQRAWQLFSQHHSTAEALHDVPKYLRERVLKIKGNSAKA